MNTSTKKGYITLEAAIVLPIFIIAIATLAFTIKIIYFQETAFFIAGNSSALLSQNASFMPENPMFPSRTVDEIKDNLKTLNQVQITSYYYKYEFNGVDNLISYNLELKSDTGLPGNMTGLVYSKQAFMFRAFCGKDNSDIYPDIFVEDEDETVYVFPNRGERYHNEDCSHLNPHPAKTVLSGKIRRRYQPCELCEPENLNNGSVVYVFKNGDVYHIGKCSTVDKYYVGMKKGDAVKRGYTPCHSCRGN